MAIIEKNGIKVNTEYQYEDNDIHKILAAKIEAYYANKPDTDKPVLLACTDVIDIPGTKEVGLNKVLQPWKDAPKKKCTALIPCNLGMNHWVGIFIRTDDYGNIDRAEYIDSIPGNEVNEQLQVKFNEIYPKVKLEKRTLLTQNDMVSCGAYVVENLFLLAIDGLVQNDLTIENIRFAHLKLLKDSPRQLDKQFYDKLVDRQYHNKIKLEVFRQQWKWCKPDELSNEDINTIINVNNELHKLTDSLLKDQLLNAFTPGKDESHKEHLDRIRITFTNLEQQNIVIADRNIISVLKKQLFADHVNMDNLSIKYEILGAISQQKALDNLIRFSQNEQVKQAIADISQGAPIIATKKLGISDVSSFSSEKQGKSNAMHKKPFKKYNLSQYKIKFKDKDVTFLELLKIIEGERDTCTANLSLRENLNILLLHLENEQMLINELTACLSKIDLEREYGSIILDDSSLIGDATLELSSGKQEILPPPTGGKVPPPPPPPPISTKGIAPLAPPTGGKVPPPPPPPPISTKGIAPLAPPTGGKVPPPPPPPPIPIKGIAPLAPHVGKMVPPPPPPPPHLNRGTLNKGSLLGKNPMVVSPNVDKKSVSIANLENMLRKYSLSTAQLPKELAKLTNHSQVTAFLVNAKKELSKIKTAIETELAVQDKVRQSIQDFLAKEEEVLIGTDNHAKICIIKFFLHKLYREIYIENDSPFYLVGVDPYDIKKNEFYTLDVNQEPYISLANKSPQELNESIGEEIAALIACIRDIKDKSQNKGCFNADQLVDCMRNLSKIEQEAFIALNLSKETLEAFTTRFKDNTSLRENYNDDLCGECLIALTSLNLFLSLTEKEVEYINDLGIVEQDDIEKLFFILMQSSSLLLEEGFYNKVEMNRDVSSLKIKNALTQVELGNIGSDPDTLLNLLKKEDFLLSNDPITGIPAYCFGFIENKKLGQNNLSEYSLLGYLNKMKLNTKIIFHKDKCHKLFKKHFGKEISEKKLTDLEQGMQKGLKHLRDRKVKESSLIKECNDLVNGLADKEVAAKLLIMQYTSKAKKESVAASLLGDININEGSVKSIPNLILMQEIIAQNTKRHENFCLNVFNFVRRSVEKENGIVFRLTKINQFIKVASGCSSFDKKTAIIKNLVIRKEIKKVQPITNKQPMTSKKYMKDQFASCLGDLLAWVDNENKLQRCLTVIEYERIIKYTELLTPDLIALVDTYKKQVFLSTDTSFKVKSFDTMDATQKQNCSIMATKLRDHFLKINNIFTVNLYNEITTLEQAKEILAKSEIIDFLKGIIYRELVINYKNSQLCDCVLLKNLKDEDNLYQYFHDLQALAELDKTFFNHKDRLDFLEGIKQKLGINLLTEDALNTISELTVLQFEELIRELATHQDCPSYLEKIAASDDIEKDWLRFKYLLQDIKIYNQLIKNMEQDYTKELAAIGIALDGVISLEEISSKLPSNVFARIIVNCIAEQNKENQQIKNLFESIKNSNNLHSFTEEQIIQLNELITKNVKHANGLADVKYFGLPKHLIERDCIFVSVPYVDDQGTDKEKYIPLTEANLSISQKSYYKELGFKSKLTEALTNNHFTFLNRTNPRSLNQTSLLSHFTLVELAIIVRCINKELVSGEQKLLLENANQCIGKNGEGLVQDFVEIIQQEEVRIAIFEAIKQDFMIYIHRLIIKLHTIDADDKNIEMIIDDINTDENNILYIIQDKIGRDFHEGNILVELDLSIDSARQTINNPQKIKAGSTLWELWNHEVKADPEACINGFKTAITEEFEQAHTIKEKVLSEALSLAVEQGKIEFQTKTTDWELNNNKLILIPENLISNFSISIVKGINSLKLNKHLFEAIVNNRDEDDAEVVQIKNFLIELGNQTNDLMILVKTVFDPVCKTYKQGSLKSFEEIKKFHDSIIEQTDILFTNDVILDGIDSVFKVTYETLFEPHLNTLVAKYESFVNRHNNQLSTLQEDLIDKYSDITSKIDNLNKLIEDAKNKFALNSEFDKHKEKLDLDQLQDQAAKELIEQKMQIEHQVYQLRKEQKEVMSMVQKEILEVEEKLQRSFIEKEAMIREANFLAITIDMQKQTHEHEGRLSQLFLDEAKERTQLIEEEAEESKKIEQDNINNSAKIEKGALLLKADLKAWLDAIETDPEIFGALPAEDTFNQCADVYFQTMNANKLEILRRSYSITPQRGYNLSNFVIQYLKNKYQTLKQDSALRKKVI